MKKLFLFFCLLLLSITGTVLSQNTYYWSGGQKIMLVPDSSQVLVSLTENADVSRNQHRIRQLGNNTSRIIRIGRNTNLLLEKVSNYSVLEKSLYSNLSDREFHIPVFRSNGTPVYFTNKILLQPKLGTSVDRLLRLANNRAALREVTKYGMVILQVSRPENLFTLANLIYESGLVEWCHPDFLVRIKTTQTPIVIPTDPLYPNQYYLNNTGQAGGFPGIDINAPEAWAITRGCNNIRVAVVDDGVEEHEDLAGRVLGGFTPDNPINGNGRPALNCQLTPNPGDVELRTGHGLACAGIIAASHNNVGIAGVAPNAQIIPVNIFATGGENVPDLVEAINFAWDPTRGNADIISNSWAFIDPPANIGGVDALTQAINNARTQGRLRNGVARGCVVIFASGNYHPRNGCPNPTPQCFNGVTYPANVNGVITVGAINNSTPTGDIWDYSSRGPEMDLVAPSGGANGAAFYEGCAIPTGDVVTTDRMGIPGYTNGNYTATFNGTSAACPQVSGAAALMLSINPNLTEAQVRTILQQTATDMGASGFDNTFGFGRLNVEAALRRVISDMGISIAGANPVCTSTTYQVNGLPAGFTLTGWRTTDQSIFNITNAGLATRVGGSTGTVSVIADLNTPCGVVSVSRPIEVGALLAGTFTYGSVSPGNQPRLIQTVNFFSVPISSGGVSVTACISQTGASGWQWTLQSGNAGFFPSSTGCQSFTLNVGNSATFVVSANVAGAGCGRVSRTVTFSVSGGGGWFRTFPNPANDELNIVAAEGDDATPTELSLETMPGVNESVEAEVKLIDANNQTLRQGKMSKGKLKFKTANIRDGLYYLQVQDKDRAETRQILIRH